MKFLPLIWAGLWRKPTRTAFTLLSIMIAFLLFGLLQGVNAAFSSGVEGANLSRLYVQSKISFTESLPISQLQRIQSVPGVTAVTYASWFGGLDKDKRLVFSFPVEAASYFAMYPEFKLPADQLQALLRTRTGAVIGAGVAEKYGWKIGDHVPLPSTIWTRTDGTSNWDFDIVGIYDDPEDHTQANQFIFNESYFDEGRAFGKGTVGWYIVRIADPARAHEIGAAIDQMFANSSDETKTQNEKENTQSFLKQIGDIGFIVTSIVGAVFFTLLFLTGNTMMQSMRERVPEFAVLKTLGFTDGAVLALVLAESLALCLIAAAIGLAGAELMFPYLRSLIAVPNLPSSVLVLGVFWAVLLALVTGLPPALRARRLVIVDALAGR
jgi:putative ABC transport system permease protein